MAVEFKFKRGIPADIAAAPSIASNKRQLYARSAETLDANPTLYAHN